VGDGGTFEGLYIERGTVVVALPGETAPLVEKVALIDAEEGVQVLEVVVIADVGVIHLAAQARGEIRDMLPAVHPALVFIARLQLALVLPVVQDGRADLPLA